MKLLLQIFAVLFACLLITSAAPSASLAPVEAEEEEEVEICSRSQACRWAVCVWSQWITVNSNQCQFVESPCICPADLECTRTNAMRPGSTMIVFKYRCL